MTRTQYEEKERELLDKHLSNFGLNPFALKIIVSSYMKNVYPLPVVFDYFVKTPLGNAQAEMSIKKPGFLGKGQGSGELLDVFGVRLFCRSYFDNVSPYPVHFVYKGLEILIHTPGADPKKYKNLARDIFNPTL